MCADMEYLFDHKKTYDAACTRPIYSPPSSEKISFMAFEVG